MNRVVNLPRGFDSSWTSEYDRLKKAYSQLQEENKRLTKFRKLFLNMKGGLR